MRQTNRQSAVNYVLNNVQVFVIDTQIVATKKSAFFLFPTRCTQLVVITSTNLRQNFIEISTFLAKN